MTNTSAPVGGIGPGAGPGVKAVIEKRLLEKRK